MAPRGRITTASALKRREVAARRVQDAAAPAAEIRRLEAHINELLAALRQRDLVIAGLRREIDDGACEEEGCGLDER
jgi:hypothetical protein